MQLKPVIQSAFDVAENPFDKGKMSLTGIVHVQAQLLNCIGKIRPCQGEILESTFQTSVVRRVINLIDHPRQIAWPKCQPESPRGEIRPSQHIEEARKHTGTEKEKDPEETL